MTDQNKRVLIFTGDGKGKTTAALGIVLRAVGHGMSTFLLQFMKNSDSGEMKVLSTLPNLTVVRHGLGFVPKTGSARFEKHREKGQEALAFAEEAIKSEKYEVIVLDEVLGSITAEIIDESAVLALIQQLPPNTTLVLTGRDASKEMIAHADTVTEMKMVKHGYEVGIQAQKGVEF